MENLIKKYDYDMDKEEKRKRRMKQMDEQGIKYNPDEVVVSDDEGKEDPFRLTHKPMKYEDEPYKTEDIEQHLKDEYEKIQR